ncbi:uncharacterized protein LOC141706071 isoform X1 [Apium graveolens]|uniref:uncharacterized protein LOC141706071 isoform X1 n=1 Tax=Apium graveolens TaxID=4045 RepID=UPI003D7B85A1
MNNTTNLEEPVAQSDLVQQHVGQSDPVQSIAGLFIFIIIFAFQFSSKYLGILRKMKGSTSTADAQLRAQIKQLYKEASTLSQKIFVLEIWRLYKRLCYGWYHPMDNGIYQCCKICLSTNT